MKKVIAVFTTVTCLLVLVCGCQATVAVKAKKVAEPIITDFQMEQVGEDLRIRFSFQNLAGGIGKAVRTNQLTWENRDGISILITYENFSPQTFLREVICNAEDLCDGSAEFMVTISDEVKHNKMRIGYAMTLSDALGRKTEPVRKHIIYEKRIEL